MRSANALAVEAADLAESQRLTDLAQVELLATKKPQTGCRQRIVGDRVKLIALQPGLGLVPDLADQIGFGVARALTRWRNSCQKVWSLISAATSRRQPSMPNSIQWVATRHRNSRTAGVSMLNLGRAGRSHQA